MSEEKIISGYAGFWTRAVWSLWSGTARSFWTQTAATEPASTKALAKLARPLPPYWKRNQDKQYTRGYRVPIRGSPGCMNLRGKLRDKRIHLTFRRWGVRAIGWFLPALTGSANTAPPTGPPGALGHGSRHLGEAAGAVPGGKKTGDVGGHGPVHHDLSVLREEAHLSGQVPAAGSSQGYKQAAHLQGASVCEPNCGQNAGFSYQSRYRPGVQVQVLRKLLRRRVPVGEEGHPLCQG